jgi:endonuclease YncB( thermonuclease family)
LRRNVLGGKAVSCCVAVLLGIAPPATAAKPHYELTGRVVAIADGDTLTVLDDAKVQHKIRLAGIDAPERKQPFGTKSREALADKVFGRDIRVEVIDVDRYHREVGRIYLGGRFVNMGNGPRRVRVALRPIRQAGRVHRRGSRRPRASTRLVGG